MVTKFVKKYSCFWNFTGILRKCREFWVNFWELRSKFFVFAKFQNDSKLPKKAVFWDFTGILKNNRYSDMIFEFNDQNYLIPQSFKEIGQFLSFSPRHVLTLLIECGKFKNLKFWPIISVKERILNWTGYRYKVQPIFEHTLFFQKIDRCTAQLLPYKNVFSRKNQNPPP